METVFRNQLISKNPSLRGNLFAIRFLEMAHMSQYEYKILRTSQSYFTTGSLPPISSSWRQAPWGSRPKILVSIHGI
jgi:hypothetical protein